MNERRQKLVEKYYQNKIQGVSLVLDNVWDPHNVAAVSRSADGFGIETIYLYYTYNKCPNMRQVGSSSSSSANRWIRFERARDLSFFHEKKAEGYQIWGADFQPEATNLTRCTIPDKCLIVMGSESKGISPELREIMDQYIFIPMVGMVESFNISVATSVILYEVYRQRGLNLSLQVDMSLRGKRQ